MTKTLMAIAAAAGLGITVPETADAGGNWYAYSGHGGHSYGFSYHSSSRKQHYGHSYSKPRGHYEYRTKKVWVPGRWHYSTDACGRTTRTYQCGRHEYRKVKVWVPHHTRSHGRRSHRSSRCRY